MTTLTMADQAERNAHKLSTGEVVDFFGNTWDGVDVWDSMKITQSDLASNFDRFFAGWRYPGELDYNFYALYFPS
eukprot:IDg8116t1